MSDLVLEVDGTGELPKAAKQIIDFAGETRVFLFDALMGAGKTTLIKELCKALGVKDNMSSPTYSLINQYQGNTGPIYHMDLYRAKSPEELMDIGVEEYLDSGNYCFIEWPEHIKGLIPGHYVNISISVGTTERYLRCSHKS
jgi:tRNA threonylcarbamoyladenosine biosynthesis protein TsaE